MYRRAFCLVHEKYSGRRAYRRLPDFQAALAQVRAAGKVAGVKGDGYGVAGGAGDWLPAELKARKPRKRTRGDR